MAGKKIFLRIAAVSALAGLGAAVSLSQQPKVSAAHENLLAENPVITGLPSADVVLAKYEKFMGGKAALVKVATRTVWTRRIQETGAPDETILLHYSKKPNFSIMRHNNLDATLNHWQNGCDGRTGWQHGTGEQIKDVGPNVSAGPMCHQELYYYGYLPLDLEAMKVSYKTLEVKSELKVVQPPVTVYGSMAGGVGQDLVGAGPRDAYLVLGVAAREGDEGAWFLFDKETGALLRRQSDDGATPGPPAANAKFTSFLQYRQVGDGTVAPFQWVSQNKNSITRGVATKIEDNAPLDDKLFIMPKSALREDKGLQ